MKKTTKTATEATPKSRYAELKRMLEERRREIQAEVQGKMRDVRAEGTWGGKQNEVFDAVESSEADIQDDIEFALIQMKSETLNKINDALIGSSRATTATASSAARRSPRSVCARCRSRSAARTAKRRARWPSSASVRWRPGAARRRSSSTCNVPATSGAPPVAEPAFSPPALLSRADPTYNRRPSGRLDLGGCIGFAGAELQRHISRGVRHERSDRGSQD